MTKQTKIIKSKVVFLEGWGPNKDSIFFFFRETYRLYYEKQWINAGGNPAVRREGGAPSNNLIKDAPYRATVFVRADPEVIVSFYFFLSRNLQAVL